jgi:uncharacterized membrane protein YkvA (DUF1232 family)
MADNTKSSNMLVPQKSGGLRDAINRIKLVVRLLGDRRVSALVKLIPIGALAYLISPVDLAPGIALPVIGALDDAAIVWLGSYLFVELCPPDVVKEHLKALTSNLSNEGNDEVVDGETTDMTE